MIITPEDKKQKNSLLRTLFGSQRSWYGREHSLVIFALLEHDQPMGRRELRDKIGIQYSGLDETLKELKKYRVIKLFKRGNSKMAELNKKSDIVKSLRKLARACAKEQMIYEL